MGLFSGNRASAPLGPPKGSQDAHNALQKRRPETIQGIRTAQREKQRHFTLQSLRARKDRDLAQQNGDTNKASEAEQEARAMAEAAEALGQQILILERIMEEFGFTFDLDDDDGIDDEILVKGREEYQHTGRLAEDNIKEQQGGNEYTNEVSPYMMPCNDVLDEDEAMRDLDECAKQTGWG